MRVTVDRPTLARTALAWADRLPAAGAGEQALPLFATTLEALPAVIGALAQGYAVRVAPVAGLGSRLEAQPAGVVLTDGSGSTTDARGQEVAAHWPRVGLDSPFAGIVPERSVAASTPAWCLRQSAENTPDQELWLTRDQLDTALERRIAELELGPGDTLLAPAPGSVAGLLDFLPALLAGSAIVWVPAGSWVRNPGGWLATIAREGATCVIAPAVAYNLAAKAPAQALESLDLSKWRVAAWDGGIVPATTFSALGERLRPTGFSARGHHLAALTSPPPEDGLERRALGAPCLAAFAQRRLWFLEHLLPGTPVFNMVETLEVRGSFDWPAFVTAFASLALHHASLRTTLAVAGDDLGLVVAETPPLPADLVDLRSLATGEREARAESWLAAEARRPFDLDSAEPLVRAGGLRLEDDRWLLFFNLHHAIADGWSVRVFVTELTAAYQAARRGERPQFGELPVEYADYAAWQRRQQSPERLGSLLEWWRRILAEAPPGVELPSDRPRGASPTNHGAILPWHAAAELAGRLEASQSQLGATKFQILTAVCTAVLWRWTGQDDQVTGLVSGNRDRIEIEGLIGLFVNTLVGRFELSPSAPFRTHLATTRDRLLAISEHRGVPFEVLVDELHTERDLTRSPFFGLLLQERPDALGELRLEGAVLRRCPLDTGTAKFDLSIAWQTGPERLSAELEYRTEIYDRATLERFLGHFERALRGALESPETRLADLPFLGESERRQLSAWGCGPAPAPPLGLGLHQRMARSAARHPEIIAIGGPDGETLTYGTLVARSGVLASRLRQLGVGPEARVALALRRGPDLVVALLAILEAGGAFVPLDPGHPADRLRAVLEDSEPVLLVTDGDSLVRLPSLDLPVFRLDEPEPTVESPACASEAGVPPSRAAYVLYTSGSTGRPKGVVVEHGAIVNFLDAMAERPGFSARETLLALATLAFDISLLELFLPLLAGGRVEIGTAAEAGDGEALARRLERSRVTTLQATPATWRLLLAAGWRPTPGFRAFSGGEALPWDLAGELLSRGVELWNLYGPTETTVWVATEQVLPAPHRTGVVPLGRAIPGAELRVVDKNLDTVPIGVWGELVVGGVPLARGYHRRPDLTAAAFVGDPSGPPGARLYRTGDLVRYRGDGSLEFLGRRDHQVKVRGFRIELGDVEAALGAAPGVAAAVAVVDRDDAGRGRLVGFVVGVAGAPLDLDAVGEFLRQRLPEYMVPTILVPLPELPLTASRKVDRKALPKVGPRAAEVGFTAPRTEVESQLAAVWSELLRLERVGIHDRFFALGGDSILAMQVVMRMKDRGWGLSPRDLFLHQSIAELATVVAPLAPATESPPAAAAAIDPALSADEMAKILGQLGSPGRTPRLGRGRA